jgi:hypothetical protein
MLGAVIHLSGLQFLLVVDPSVGNEAAVESAEKVARYRTHEISIMYGDQERLVLLGWPHNPTPDSGAIQLVWSSPDQVHGPERAP